MIQRPVLAVKLASLCYVWARIEQTLAVAFAILMTSEGEVHVSAPPSLNNPFEMEVIEHMESVRAKTNVVYALTTHRIDDSAILTEAKRMLDKVVRLGSQRNKYVHGRWALAEGYDEELVLMQRAGPNMVEEALLIGFDDFERLITDMWEHGTSLAHFYQFVVDPALKPKPRW